MLPLNNLGPDESGVFVNETQYQANPKESHLVAVKRIFRFLKGTLNLSLWYPKGPGFDLKAYSDSDYAGCKLDRKSTSGRCQILEENPLDKASADYGILYEKVPIFCDNTSAVTPRQGGNARRIQEWISSKHMIEPKKVIKALEEEGWVIAIQEEHNQFKRNKVWTLVLAPYSKTIIGTKWIFRNKMDENGVARLEASRIFLAYAAYIGFVVYQMDVKCTCLNGKLSEEVYVQQPPGFESSEFPNYVFKLDKVIYGLKQAPKVWYQANPKESYLVVVKRIFRYLKGTPNLSLWYPKGPGFDLKAYSDSDYAGYKLDRKSTSGGCQILEEKLIKSQLADYDILYEKVPIFCDNTSAITISDNLVLHSRTKHIDKEVIAGNIARKSLSGTTVQSTDQPKASIDKRSKKKKIQSSFEPKTSKMFITPDVNPKNSRLCKDLQQPTHESQTLRVPKLHSASRDYVTIVKEVMEDPMVIDSKNFSLGNVAFDQAVNLKVEESPFDAKSKIKFIEKVDLNHEMKDNVDITFMGSSSFDQVIEEADSDLESIPDD
ncbi:retrovirus-related pol polyprotein from transposon TNT 1-94 [Tanacetum coccineum]